MSVWDRPGFRRAMCRPADRVVARQKPSVAQVRKWTGGGGRRAPRQVPCQTRCKVIAGSSHGCKVAEEMCVLGCVAGAELCPDPLSSN